MTGSPDTLVPAADAVRIRLLGGFGVSVLSYGSERLLGDRWRLRKDKSLVTLLALSPVQAVHRDELADALCGDRPAAAAVLDQFLSAAPAPGPDVRAPPAPAQAARRRACRRHRYDPTGLIRPTTHRSTS